MACLASASAFSSPMKSLMVCLITMWCLSGRGMFVAPYDGGSGGGALSNSLLCWFNKWSKNWVLTAESYFIERKIEQKIKSIIDVKRRQIWLSALSAQKERVYHSLLQWGNNRWVLKILLQGTSKITLSQEKLPSISSAVFSPVLKFIRRGFSITKFYDWYRKPTLAS